MAKKKHRYELFFSAFGWTIVDTKKGEEWMIDSYCGDQILKNDSYGKMAFKNKEIRAIPIPESLATKLIRHTTKMLMKYDPEDE